MAGLRGFGGGGGGRGPPLLSPVGFFCIVLPLLLSMLICRKLGDPARAPFTPSLLAAQWHERTLELAKESGLKDVVGMQSTVVSSKNQFGEEELPPFTVEYHGAQVAVWSSYSSIVPEAKGVTWVTQFTVDRLPVFLKLLQRWPGPISAAIWTRDVAGDIGLLKPLFGRVDVHLVAGAQGLYPVNTLRNLAIDKARTSHILLADVDFIPNIDAYELIQKRFPEFVAKPDVVWVVPAFETSEDTIPEKKADLLGNLYFTIRPVHDNPGRAAAHKPTNYVAWRGATQPYPAEYIMPYEPYYIAAKNIPRFDAKFAGYGNDKTFQAYELSRAGYTYMVLPDCFLVHVNHPGGAWISETLTPQQDRMERIVQVAMQEIHARTEKEANPPTVLPNLQFKAVAAEVGVDCDKACEQVRLVCNPAMQSAVNLCAVMSNKFDCSYGCSRQYFGPELPLADPNKKLCYVNGEEHKGDFHCDAITRGMRRMCPCSATK